MQALVEQSRIVRLPLNQVGNLNRINRTFPKLEQMYERNPSVCELAEQMGIEAACVEELLKMSSKHTSLEVPFNDDDGNSMLDVLAEEEFTMRGLQLDKESLCTEVYRTLACLPERERATLCMFYGIGEPEKTLVEIGMVLNLSRERVRQIKEKTMKKLRLNEYNKLLKPFLGV